MSIKSLQELIEKLNPKVIFILFYFVMVSYALYFELKYPYFWFDEAINIHFLSERSFFDLLIPGKTKYHLGGQSLYLAIYSLFSYLGMSHHIVFILNQILLAGVFYNLYRICDFKKINTIFSIGLLTLISFNPYLIYYLCEYKQYMLDILISIYLLRLFIENRVLNMSYIKMGILFLLSITPIFFLPQAFVLSFRNNYKTALKKLCFIVIVAFSYKAYHAYKDPTYYSFMKNFWGSEVQRFLNASFGIQISKSIMFFRLVSFSFKSNLISVFLLLITLFGALKIEKVSAYYLMLYLGLITSSALGFYPVPTLDKVYAIVQSRIVVFTIIPTILILVLSIYSIPEKLKILRNIVFTFTLIVVSYSNLVHGHEELTRSFKDQEKDGVSFYNEPEFIRRSLVCMEGGVHTLHLANNISKKNTIVINPYENSIKGDRGQLDGCFIIIKDFSFKKTQQFLETKGFKLININKREYFYYAIIKSK